MSTVYRDFFASNSSNTSEIKDKTIVETLKKLKNIKDNFHKEKDIDDDLSVLLNSEAQYVLDFIDYRGKNFFCRKLIEYVSRDDKPNTIICFDILTNMNVNLQTLDPSNIILNATSLYTNDKIMCTFAQFLFTVCIFYKSKNVYIFLDSKKLFNNIGTDFQVNKAFFNLMDKNYDIPLPDRYKLSVIGFTTIDSSKQFIDYRSIIIYGDVLSIYVEKKYDISQDEVKYNFIHNNMEIIKHKFSAIHTDKNYLTSFWTASLKDLLNDLKNFELYEVRNFMSKYSFLKIYDEFNNFITSTKGDTNFFVPFLPFIEIINELIKRSDDDNILSEKIKIFLTNMPNEYHNIIITNLYDSSFHNKLDVKNIHVIIDSFPEQKNNVNIYLNIMSFAKKYSDFLGNVGFFKKYFGTKTDYIAKTFLKYYQYLLDSDKNIEKIVYTNILEADVKGSFTIKETFLFCCLYIIIKLDNLEGYKLFMTNFSNILNLLEITKIDIADRIIGCDIMFKKQYNITDLPTLKFD